MIPANLTVLHSPNSISKNNSGTFLSSRISSLKALWPKLSWYLPLQQSAEGQKERILIKSVCTHTEFFLLSTAITSSCCVDSSGSFESHEAPTQIPFGNSLVLLKSVFIFFYNQEEAYSSC